MNRESVVGTWRLVSFQGRNAKGESKAAFGKDAQGLLVYTTDGHMIAVLSEENRKPFHSGDFRGGTPEEVLVALKSYISYCGRYTVGERIITHHVTMSLFPNWIGQDQIRNFRFENGDLILSTPAFSLSGNEWTFELIWQRLE